MKKRVFALLLALIMVLVLAACVQTKANVPETENPATGSPVANVVAAPNLDDIAYVVGDRADCKMDADMAEAYAKAVEQAKVDMVKAEYYNREYDDLYVALADFAGDGYPILITTVLDKGYAVRTGAYDDEGGSPDGGPFLGELAGAMTFWEYRDGEAHDAKVRHLSYSCGYGKKDGKGLLYKTDFSHEYPPTWPIESNLYTISQGKIELERDRVEYYAWENYGEFEGASGELNGVFPEDADYVTRIETGYDGATYIHGSTSISALQSNGWIKDEYGAWVLTIENGENVTRQARSEASWRKTIEPYEEGCLVFIWDWADAIAIETTPADEAIAALRGWAANPVVPTYKVTLRLDTGNVSVDTAQDRPMTVPTNPTKEGYTFGGWYIDADLTRPWNFNTTVTGDMELYGKWVPLTSTAVTTGRSSQTITVNGAPVALEAYTLAADSNGGDVTFVKLRDVAAVLDGTEDQFNVEWKSGAIYVTTKNAYTGRNGTELQPIVVDTTGYKQNTSPVLFDGETKSLEGIVITDVDDGGHTFFKLRDLADAIGFAVDWSAEQGIYIKTE